MTAITINWNLIENERIGRHHISRCDDHIHVFGNDRTFPVPSGWRLIDAFIGLVDTDPSRSRMELPKGQVDVYLPTNTLLAIGDIVPNGVETVRVETPLAQGVSNWAGIKLVFKKSTS